MPGHMGLFGQLSLNHLGDDRSSGGGHAPCVIYRLTCQMSCGVVYGASFVASSAVCSLRHRWIYGI
jgi:hypothetical protein